MTRLRQHLALSIAVTTLVAASLWRSASAMDATAAAAAAAAASAVAVTSQRWPKIVVHSESPLRPCLRVFEGINGVATISSLKSQAGKDSVSYSLVISGTASPPIHSSLVIGNPCNPLMSPKHFLTMNGTWVAWSYKNQPAWMLQGRVTTPKLVRAVLSYGRSYGGDLSDLRVAFFGNQTLAGRMKLVGVTTVAPVMPSTLITQRLARFGTGPEVSVSSEVPGASDKWYMESGRRTASRQGRPLGHGLRGEEEAW